MKSAIGSPAALSLPIGRKTPGVADKAERGERTEPLKPFGRIGGESQLPFLRADEHIGPSSPHFHPWDDASTCPQLAWLERSLEGALALGSNDRHLLCLDGHTGCALGEQSLQRAQAAFIPLRALAKEFQGELGQLFLQGHDFRLQAANSHSEPRFFRARGRSLSQTRLVWLNRGRGRKRRSERGGFLPQERGSGSRG